MAFYRCGGGGIPSSLKTDMNAVLNKKFGTSSDYPPADWAPTVNLMGPLPEKTIVSSPIADFSDGADDVPTKSLVVTIPPTLSGVSSLNETQTGKNIWSLDSSLTIVRDKSYSGIKIPAGTYTLSFDFISSTADPAPTTMQISYATSDGTKYNPITIVQGRCERTFTLAYDATSITIYSASSYSASVGVTTVIQNIQLEIGNVSPTTYEAYNATQYTASLGRTIYGGTADIVNGEGTDEGVIEAFDTIEGNVIKSQFNSFNKVNGNISVLGTNVRITFAIESGDQSAYNRISNTYTADEQLCNLAPHSFSYASDTKHWYRNTVLYLFLPVADVGTTAESVFNYLTGLITNGTPLKFYLPYNTATDFTFDGQEIPTRLGYNAFWSDEGDTEVTYRASGTIYQYPRGEEASF